MADTTEREVGFLLEALTACWWGWGVKRVRTEWTPDVWIESVRHDPPHRQDSGEPADDDWVLVPGGVNALFRGLLQELPADGYRWDDSRRRDWVELAAQVIFRVARAEVRPGPSRALRDNPAIERLRSGDESALLDIFDALGYPPDRFASRQGS